MREIVDAYIRECREPARRELRYYSNQATLADAIRQAALSRLRDGSKHSHQYRIPGGVLALAERLLQRAAQRLRNAPDFATLHGIVEKEIGPIPGIGDLAVYDIAHRIGAFVGVAPTLVYLHAGTRDGARALGFRGKQLDPHQLPDAFGKLSPAEIEDCLCIYKSHFRRRKIGQPTSCTLSDSLCGKQRHKRIRHPRCS